MRMRVRMCMAVLVRGIYCISTQTTTVATASTPIALPYSSTHLHDEGEEGNHGQAAVLELGERPVLADAVGGEAEGVEADVCRGGRIRGSVKPRRMGIAVSTTCQPIDDAAIMHTHAYAGRERETHTQHRVGLG